MGSLSLTSDLDQQKEVRFGRSVQPHCLYILQKHLNRDPPRKKKKAFYSTDTQPHEQTAITQTFFNERKQGNKINEINITYVLLN